MSEQIMETIFTVEQALSSMKLQDSDVKVLTEDSSIWDTFGKKNSHLLRAKLWKIMEEAKVEKEVRFVIFFLFAMIKNRERVLDAIDNLPEKVKTLPSVIKAKAFIESYLVQYTYQETAKKFAVVHLPTTMPGLDLLCTALVCGDTEEDLNKNIISKQTFSQIYVSQNLQEENKTYQRVFWEKIVTTSKNEERTSKRLTVDLKFHEEFYNTAASDKYLLLDYSLKEVKPKSVDSGYTKEEMLAWFKSVKAEQKKRTSSK